MPCTICRQAVTMTGSTALTLERDQLIYVVKHVPAQVCPNCGEAYVDEQTAAGLPADADTTSRHGAEVIIRNFRSLNSSSENA